MRPNVPLMVRASALTSSVLPRPGTPSTSTWPPASSAHSTASITSGWPISALEISARIAAATFDAWPNCSAVGLFILFRSFFQRRVHALGLLCQLDEIGAAHRAAGADEAMRLVFGGTGEGGDTADAIAFRSRGEVRLCACDASQRRVARGDHEARAQSLYPVVAAARAQVIEQAPPSGRHNGRDRPEARHDAPEPQEKQKAQARQRRRGVLLQEP